MEQFRTIKMKRRRTVWPAPRRSSNRISCGDSKRAYFGTSDPHRFLRTLDGVPRLCVRAIFLAERALYRMDFNAFPLCGATGHIYILFDNFRRPPQVAAISPET